MTSTQPIAWITQLVGPSVLALFKNYQARKDEVLGKVFYAVRARITYPQLAEILEKSLWSRSFVLFRYRRK